MLIGLNGRLGEVRKRSAQARHHIPSGRMHAEYG